MYTCVLLACVSRWAFVRCAVCGQRVCVGVPVFVVCCQPVCIQVHESDVWCVVHRYACVCCVVFCGRVFIGLRVCCVRRWA